MSLTRVLLLAAVLGLGYKLWSGHQQEALLQASTTSSPSGVYPGGDARWCTPGCGDGFRTGQLPF